MENISVLWGNKKSTKHLVFRILISEHPLKLIELTNLIKKRYGKSVTFQAVRQAVFELVKENVLEQKDKRFEINPSWIFYAKETLNKVENEINKSAITPSKIESIQGELSVFTFTSLNKMMKFWQQIIDKWFREFKRGDYHVNCWQGQHIWEALLHLETEEKVMNQLKKNGIKSYAIIYSDTPLDVYIRRFYTSIGLKIKNIRPKTEFDKTYYVGTYGDTIIQAKYPKELVEKMDKFFKKSKTIENIRIHDLNELANTKINIKLTVIKNLEIAKQINKTIIDQLR